MKKNNFLACLLGIICGFIFSIPWILIYALFGLSVGYLSILIVFGIIIGYKLINKDIYNNCKTKAYLITSACFIALFNVLIIIPALTIASVKGINLISNLFDFEKTLSMSNLVEYYKSGAYIESAIINSILSVAMVLIPAILLPMDFKKSKDELSDGDKFKSNVEEIFKKYNAFDKETAVDKKIIKDEIKNINISNLKKAFYVDMLKGPKIKSTKGKWCYNLNKKKNLKLGFYFTFLALILFASIWNIFMVTFDVNKKIEDKLKLELKESTKNKEYILGDKISIMMPDCMKYYEDKYDNETTEYYYYQYISENTLKSDIEAIQLYYYPNYELSDNYDLFKNNLKESFNDYDIIDETDKVINNRKSIYYKLDKYDNNRITNVYFIPYDEYMFELYVYINKENSNENNQKISDDIASSIKIINQE